MSTILAAGANYRLERQGDVIVATLWRRPDLSRDDCARLVRETVYILLALAGDQTVKGLVWDLHEAPLSWGPLTHKAFADGISSWDLVKKPVAVLPAGEALSRLAVRALVNEAAPRRGKIASSLEEALLWAGLGPPPPTSPPAART